MCKGYPCPCCGYLTLGEKPPGTYEICPVCFWEDDYVQYHDPDFAGGANEMSLNEARASFCAIGAVSQDLLEYARPPYKCEIPENGDPRCH